MEIKPYTRGYLAKEASDFFWPVYIGGGAIMDPILRRLGSESDLANMEDPMTQEMILRGAGGMALGASLAAILARNKKNRLSKALLGAGLGSTIGLSSTLIG